jgi:predicted DNA-binding protein
MQQCKKPRPVQVPINLPRDIAQALKTLSHKTRISQQAYLREALSDLLRKYSQEVRDER